MRQNIQSDLIARGVFASKKHEADEFLQLVGLESFANAYPHHLSGDIAHRVALTHALINNPKVQLHDEPLGALDALTRMRMQDALIRIWQAREATITRPST